MAASPSTQAYRAERSITHARAVTIVALLCLLNVASFADRFVVTLLVTDLHRDLGLTDFQYAIIVGPAFMISYALVNFPISICADLFNRQVVLAAGVLLWSAMTIASGWATSFETLLLLRAGLAVGEAVLSPVAISLVGDLFPPAARRIPMLLLVAASQIGVAVAALAGALALQVADAHASTLPAWLPRESWRLAFVFVGLIPLVVGAIYMFVAIEPARGAKDEADVKLVSTRDHVRSHWRLYALSGILACLAAIVGFNIPVWAPTFLARRFDMTAINAGYTLGGTFLVASVAGVLALPVMMRVFGKGQNPTTAMLSIARYALLLGPALMATAALTSSVTIAVLAFGGALFFSGLVYPLPTQMFQLHTPSAIRARLSSVILIALFLMSSGVGPLLVPTLMKLLPQSGNSLGVALGVVAGVMALCSVAALRWLGGSVTRMDARPLTPATAPL